jgi:hypothetical protein
LSKSNSGNNSLLGGIYKNEKKSLSHRPVTPKVRIKDIYEKTPNNETNWKRNTLTQGSYRSSMFKTKSTLAKVLCRIADFAFYTCTFSRSCGFVRMLLLLLFGVFCLGLRRPSCVGTARNVSASDLELFRYAFRDFEEGASRIGGRDFLNFEFLIGNGMGLIDQASFLVVARQAELLVNSLNVSASDTLSLISKLFRLRAESGLGDASEQAAWWTLAFRFNQSDMQAFNRQYALLERATPCQLVQISGLFGLWCPSPSATAPRVIAMTGFDGSLLTVYAEVCKDANAHGLSCLCLMGPGQGESAVLGNARFVSDWGGVVQKAAEWLGGKGPIMLWCRSFGGQLCARVGQTTPNVSAIVLDGGLKAFQKTDFFFFFFFFFSIRC